MEGATTTWYHSDPAGNPMAATDQNGVLAWRTNYRPYGEKLVGLPTRTPSGSSADRLRSKWG
ncbi:RHS domain-containing protein [Chitiniphilus eburneus]|uniref:RHS domain-containing protein n=1 Tax=Chitiniphilus eburneus TaxID=2571148 RepID=UPI0035CFCC27